MSERLYPRAHRLVLRLLSLKGTDTLLPMQVLINLHKRELRRPLENMRHLFSPDELAAFEGREMDPSGQFAARVADAFPSLSGGLPYYSSSQVKAVLKTIPAFRADPIASAFVDHLGENDPVLARVITAALDGWVAYQPLVSLHQLTWSPDTCARRLPLLEAELAAGVDAGPMIRWLAAKDEATVSHG